MSIRHTRAQYVSEAKIHTLLTYHFTNYIVCSGPLFIVLYLALTTETLDTPGIYIHACLYTNMHLQYALFQFSPLRSGANGDSVMSPVEMGLKVGQGPASTNIVVTLL